MKVNKAYIDKLTNELNKYCFTAGSEKYAQEKGIGEITPDIARSIFTSKDKRIEFSAYVNWSYKEAQKIIIKERLRLEDAIKSKTLEFTKQYNQQYVIALLRDYADSIAWIMLKHDISAVRNFFLEHKKHSPLKEQNWESIQKSLDYFNKDDNQFALATDLTSFFQIGDLYCLNTKTGAHHLIEVKTGKVNDKILEAISAKDLDGFKQKSLELLRESPNPVKTSKQVARTLRQHQRAATSLKYRGYGSNKRTELRTGRDVKIHEEKRDEENWSVAVREVIEDMEKNDIKYATGWVDYCLFFAFGRKPLTNLDEAYFKHRINQHFKYGLSEEEAQMIPVFRHQGMLGAPTLTPRALLYSSNLGMEHQKKLITGEEFLLVYLSIPALSHMLKENGYELKLRNMKKGDQPYNDQLMRDLFGQNKFPVVSKQVDGESYDWTILSGTWSRIIFDFMAPIEVANYSGTIIEKSQKLKQQNNKKRKRKKKK